MSPEDFDEVSRIVGNVQFDMVSAGPGCYGQTLDLGRQERGLGCAGVNRSLLCSEEGFSSLPFQIPNSLPCPLK